MEINHFLDKFIIDWLENIEEITDWDYVKGPNPNFVNYDLEIFPRLSIFIDDNKKNRVLIRMKLDGVSNPRIYFLNPYISFDYEADVSICELVIKVFKDKGLIR